MDDAKTIPLRLPRWIKRYGTCSCIMVLYYIVCIFGFYENFKSQFAEIDRLSLTNRRGKGDPNKLVWEDEHQKIFEPQHVISNNVVF